jgi:hypothetical protein
MNDVISNDIFWHKDNHVIHLQLNKSEVSIVHVHCPNNEDRECRVGKFECIVSWFLDRYGLECNVGICDISSEIEIAWSAVGEDFDDPELCQVWVIPVNDEAFSAWLITQE